MLLDAHGGAVAAGSHGLWLAALRAALAVAHGRRRWLCGGCEGMSLLLLLERRGRPGTVLMQRARRSAALWRVRAPILVRVRRRGPVFVDNVLLASGL